MDIQSTAVTGKQEAEGPRREEAMASHEQPEQQKGSCLLLRLNDLQMLVPRTVVAEVIKHSFITFRQDKHTGLDIFEWRGHQVPHLKSDVAGDTATAAAGEEARVVIFHGLKDPRLLPYYGFTITGSPQLLHVSDGEIREVSAAELHPAQLMQVTLNDSAAFIPKVDHFENTILKLMR